MTLIKCSECRNELNEKETLCSNCGFNNENPIKYEDGN